MRTGFLRGTRTRVPHGYHTKARMDDPMKQLCCRFLCVLAALLLCLTAALGEGSEVVATVNGEDLTRADYTDLLARHMALYGKQLDLLDPSVMAYVDDLALTAAIQRLLLRQDMRARGCFDLDAETEAWCQEQGEAAYAQALADVGEMLRQKQGLPADADMTQAARDYAAQQQVTVEDYTAVFREQYASAQYDAWLTREDPVTPEQVDQAYAQRIAADEARYAQDVAAFETALQSGQEVWYTPAGYRSVLQILLPAQGATDAEKLASVAEQTAEIEARLQAGEAFADLIGVYGTDRAMQHADFLHTGYQVHRDSVVWEDAFVEAAFAMEAPGDWSAPIASDKGVHILYYLKDVPAGAVPLTEDLRGALQYTLYAERCQTLRDARLEELSDAAEVVLP